MLYSWTRTQYIWSLVLEITDRDRADRVVYAEKHIPYSGNQWWHGKCGTTAKFLEPGQEPVNIMSTPTWKLCDMNTLPSRSFYGHHASASSPDPHDTIVSCAFHHHKLRSAAHGREKCG